MVTLSVDFGTSNSVAALSRDDERVRMLLFDGSPALPSAVFLDPSGVLLVGRDAVHSARMAPERYEPNPKRRIDDQTVLLGDSVLPVVELIAAVLRSVAAEAQRVAGAPVAHVVLTHPAAWAHTRQEMLVRAAERAALPLPTLVPEPVAAADTFLAVSGGTVPVGGSLVVYDLGAGTFDASVVRRSAAGFDVVAAEGLSQAGGLDIDAAIVGYLAAMDAGRHAEAWTRLLRPSTSEQRRANRLLWEDVRVAKELLSRAGGTHVHVPLVGLDVPLSREQFEFLARPILDATVTATRAALNSARVATGDVADVFLVGGGSRIPLVATLLQQAFGRAPTIIEQPELAVAEGGLRVAARRATLDAVPPGPLPVAALAPMYAPGEPSSAGPAMGSDGVYQVSAQPAGPTLPVSGIPVSAQPMSGAPVSAQPVSGAPVSAQPVSGAPVSAQPVSGAPVSAQPVSGAPVSAQPMSGAPVSAQPVSGGPVPPGRSGGPAGAASPRSRRPLLIGIAVAAVLVLVLGTTILVVALRGETVEVNRTLLDEGGHRITMVSFQVRSGTLRVNLHYENDASNEWSLTCPAKQDDLQGTYLYLYDSGRKIYPTETWCTANVPEGKYVPMQAGESGDSYAVFPAVPAKGTSFSLKWYSWTMEDLKL